MGQSSFGRIVSSVSRPAIVPSLMTVILRGLREIKSMDILTRTITPSSSFRWMVLWHCKGQKVWRSWLVPFMTSYRSFCRTYRRVRR